MLSVAPDRPVDPFVLEVLTLVDHVARALDVDYFVTGAMARDIVLDGVFGIDSGRATRDVDLAVAVDDWSQFEALKELLVGTGSFTVDSRAMQRLFYRRSTERRGYPVDLLPFGGVEQRAHEVAWPPDLSVVMNVAGYREALAAALQIEVSAGVIVRVVSLPGLAVLKLFAWADRGAENRKDALDLAVLLRSYGSAGNDDRLFGEEIGLLETVNYDVDLASPRLLGKDVARITAPQTREQIVALLDAQRVDRLVRDMARAFSAVADPIAAAEESVRQFKNGFLDAARGAA